ncbi:MAG: TonB-dependent receptor, partial [Nitrococcus sp.]|nr:TonB-dependent receptor [Nitrococcus sp.]
FNNRFDGLLTVETKQRQGYRDHNKSSRVGVYANGGWRISQSLGTRVYLNYINNNRQLPGSLTREQYREDPDQAGTNALKGDFQIDVEAFRVASKTSWQIDERQSLELGVSYEKQRLYHPIVADFSVPGVPDQFIAFDGLLIETDHHDIGSMVRYENQIGNHNLLFGANYRVGWVDGKQFGNDHGHPGGLQQLIDQDADTLQAYAMDRWNIGAGDWTLVPAIQLINANRELNNTAVDDFGVRTKNHTKDHYFGVNPRLGALYHVQRGFDLFANVSRLYEPPTFFVLRNSATGAPLDAMSGTVVEVGTRGNHALPRANSTWGWNLALYYAWIKNEILTVRDPQTQQFVTSNADKTVHAGLESMIQARIAIDTQGVHAIAPQLSLSVNDFRFNGDAAFRDNYLPSAPRYVLRGQVLYRNTYGFYAGPTFDVLGKRYADFANSYKIDPYALLGFLAGWSNDQVSVYVQLENLLDENYVATNSVRTDLSAPAAAAAANVLNPGSPLAVYGGVILRFW